MSDNFLNTEQFIINDISMGISPSDIQLFDNNYVYEQSFLRSNSVYCYRSKYSDTKVVLNFPFKIEMDGTSEEQVHTTNCLKLITELNSYPFCFIKNSRVRTYISPMITSSTGYLMFAVEELALIQSAAASNMMFFEVTLRYFNFAPVAADFEFVDNNAVYKSARQTMSNGTEVEYERDMIQRATTTRVSDLSVSTVWGNYMNPKIERLYENIDRKGVMRTSTKSTDVTGLGVDIYLPMILSNAERARHLIQEDDGAFVGPDSRFVITTDVENLDDHDLPNMIQSLFNQDFQDEEEKERMERDSKKKLETTNTNSLFSPEELKMIEDGTKVNKKFEANAIKSGKRELFINYSSVALNSLGIAVQKVEVRRSNILVSQKIGTYKHPIIQYMGKNPARTNIQFLNNTTNLYTSNDEVGASAFIVNALQILDENRMNYPAAEVYNHIKINSLANVLLGADSALPNQNMVSSSADQGGVENIVYSFTETTTEKFLDSFQMEASGARSFNKAYEEVYSIVLNWLEKFKSSLQSGKISNISTDPVITTNTLKIFRTAMDTVSAIIKEMGYKDSIDDSAIQNAYKLEGDGLLSLENENKGIKLLRTTKHATGSGVVLYVNSESYSTVLTEEEEKAEVITEESKAESGFWTGVAQTLLGVSSDAVANAYLPGITTEVKKKAKHDKQVASGEFAKVNLLPGSYYFWLSSYIITMITARRAAKEGKSLNLKNVSFRPTNMTDTLMMNTAALIGASADTDPISAKLTAGQKNFLNNMADLYIGSLYGQNLEDLYLEDLDESYDVSKDVLIQSTDPFFFVRTPLILGNEMIDFYNNTYGDTALNPKIVADADAVNEPAITQADALLGIEYRKIYEVDFNAETFPYYGDSDPLPTDYEHIAVNNEDARRAIENALAKYGYSGDEEFRRYMYKAAYLESGMGTKLTSGSGASGLFQFTEIAISEIMTKNNKVFTKEGYVNLSLQQAGIAAKKVKSRASFKRDFQLSADMFIELFNINGKKHINPKTKAFDEAFTFAYHNIGSGGGQAIEAYLTKNVLHPSNPEVQKAMRGNAASGNQLSASWYGIFSAKFKNARMQLGGKLEGDGAAAKEQIVQSPAVLNLSANKEKVNTNKKLIDTKKGVIQSSVNTSTILSKAPNTSLLTQQATKVQSSQASQKSSARQVNVVGTIINATVKGIVDGDTVDIAYASNKNTSVTQRVRLAGMNTEETWKNTEGTKDWGEEAKKRLATLLPLGSKVTLNMTNNEARPINEQELAQQKASGRWIAVIKNNEGVDVTKDLLSKGLATTFFNTSQEYQEAMNAAQTTNTGQWSRTTVAAYNEAKAKSAKSSTIYKAATSNINAAEILKGATDKTRKFNTYQPFQNGQRFSESSPFTYGGPRKDMNRSSPHNGIDFSCPVGTVVVAAASGTATQLFQSGGAGLYVSIDHGNGFVTKYMHLSSTNISKKGQKIAAGQPIGKSGGAGGNPNSGGSTGAHLHYEVRFKGRAIHPYSTQKPLTEYTSGEVFTGDGSLGMAADTPSEEFLSLSYEARPNITEENTVFSEDELAQAILTGAKDDINIGLKVAVPAIKAYIMVGNENDGLGLDTLTTGSQYYELKGIQSFKLFCNNNETPVDTAIMTIIDPSFGNTDSWTSMMKAPEVDFDSIGSDYETQFKFNRALVRPGTKLSIRMGYGNDPNFLTTVFNGGVTEVNQGGSNQILTLLLEGYGRELLSEIRNPDKPKALEDADNSPTTAVIGYALESKPIDHFGYMNNHLKWLYKDQNDPEARAMVKPVSSDHAWWFTTSAAIHRSRLYMNIFAPEIERVDDTFAKNWAGQFLQSIGLSNHQFGYPFYAYQATPWDMCKQMEYRHPGSIFKPMMFEDRMTPFYGIKEQMYFSRDLSRFTQIEVAKRLKSGLKDATTQKYFDRRRERMSPVSNIHMVSSSTNLISNQIQLNGQWKTCTNVSYFTSDDAESFASAWKWDAVRMEVDDNILPWEIREKELRMSGTFGKYPAFLYGTTDLKKEAETMYSGKILITGNAKVKCGDYIFLDDLDNRLTGLALVRECIHHFDPVNGFVTEITPGLYVEPAQFMYTSLWLQLMCAMKVGSSKSRLVLSSSFSSEYEYVREYLRVVQQLKASESGDYSTPTEVIAGYSAAVGLGVYLSYALGKALGSKTPLPGQSFGKLSYTFVSAHFRTAERKLAVERLKKIRRSEWYTSGARTLKGWKSTVSSKVIGSAAYKAAMSTKTGRISRMVLRRNPLFTVPTWVVKRASGLAARAALRSGIAAVHGVASVNPITFILDVVLSLAASWAFAKIEESDLTRQPLLFFPLIKHGKPYQAGMTGSIRNTYWDSFGKEWDKTTNAVSKAAAIYEGTSIANNKQAPFLLSLLAQPAKRDKEERDETAYVMTSVGNDHEFYTRKTEVEKEAEQRRAKEAQEALLKKATKE